MLVLQILELFTQYGLTHNRLQSSPNHPNTDSKDRMPTQGELAWGHGSLGDARLNAMTTYLPGFTYSTLHLTNSKRHACGHASAPRELQDCRTIFCKQTCFSRFYFWDRKLSCKVASLQWASLAVCAWKTLEMDFRLFLWFLVFLDVV